MLSRTRRHVESERKLGEYFFLDTFNPGFQRVFEPFLRVFKVFPHSKGFQSVSKFQKLVQIFCETNRLYIGRGNSCNLHLHSTSSPAKPWLSVISQPRKGRPRRPEGVKGLKLRESTYNLWIGLKGALGVQGITNSEFAEMLQRA